jgi:hypothetical protein
MTDCFAQTRIDFQHKRIEVAFDAPRSSSDGGLLLVRQLDEQLGVSALLAGLIPDEREPAKVEHSRLEQVRQRLLQICGGYEDCNDADTLRHDPVLKMCCDRSLDVDDALSSQPTLSRFENAVEIKNIRQLVDEFENGWVGGLSKRRKQVILDIDGTDDPTHGHQQLSFFHGYYDQRIYHPLLVFEATDGALVTAILRPGNTHDCRGAVGVLDRLIRKIRQQCPRANILVRGDSAFAMPRLLERLQRLNAELGRLDYIIGVAKNPVLLQMGRRFSERAAERFGRKKQPVRVFGEFRYAAQTWSRKRRIIMKAEHLNKGANPRFIVTSLQVKKARELYEVTYCARGQTENLIKDLKNALSGDRLSCHKFSVNWLRLLLHASAYRLMHALRRKLVRLDPELAVAQLDTLRLRLIKVAAYITESARRFLVRLPASCPYAQTWCALSQALAPP